MPKYLTLGLSLLPVVVIIVGMVGWIFTLRADLDTVITAWESEDIEAVINQMDNKNTERIEEIRESLAELERVQSIQKNEMETIMADHDYMGEMLGELGERLPPGERRQYGNY
jgi:predicted PurR-regulated permease PerM